MSLRPALHRQGTKQHLQNAQRSPKKQCTWDPPLQGAMQRRACALPSPVAAATVPHREADNHAASRGGSGGAEAEAQPGGSLGSPRKASFEVSGTPRGAGRTEVPRSRKLRASSASARYPSSSNQPSLVIRHSSWMSEVATYGSSWGPRLRWQGGGVHKGGKWVGLDWTGVGEEHVAAARCMGSLLVI